jgi:hypothetical protein
MTNRQRRLVDCERLTWPLVLQQGLELMRTAKVLIASDQALSWR